MTASKNIFSILFAMLMVSCSYSSLRPEVVDRSDAQRMQTVIFATVVSVDRVILSGNGGTGPLDEWGISGMREIIRIQLLPTAAYIEAFIFIRDEIKINDVMSQQAETEFKGLLDYLINALA